MPKKTTSPNANANPADDVYLSSSQVCERYGKTSTMSLWRWLSDAKLNFPKPITIQRRRFWKLSDLVAWERRRATEAA